jgi:signal transduction histidine kinase
MLLFICLILLAFGFPGEAEATPEKIALGYPVEGITVDGDLSDWPEDMIRYPVLFQEHGDKLRGVRDFEGWMQVGYSQEENALYVAASVLDDSIVKGWPGEGSWDTQDGGELYLYRHQPDQKGPVQYFARENGHGVHGPDRPENVQSVMAWREDGYQFEWRIDITGSSGGRVELRPDQEFGFDLSLYDQDRDGTGSWIAWSPGTNKNWIPDRLGRLVLVEKDVSIAKVLTLTGQNAPMRTDSLQERMEKSIGYQMFFSGVLLAFTLLHLLLFLFDPRSKANLFYAMYTGFIGISIFSGFQLEATAYTTPETISMIRQLALMIVSIVGLCFLYSLFNPKPPRRFWVLLIVLIVEIVSVGLDISDQRIFFPFSPGIQGLLITLLSGGLFIETLIVLFTAIREKKEGAWMIGIGFSLFALNVSPLIQQTEIDISLLYWVLIPLVSMSVYLARSVTRTNKALQNQLAQVETLSQKTREQYEQIQEQNIQIQEANKLKSDFLARMSHDLRTPMNAIIGYTRILLRKSKEALDERQYRNLENVQISANNLLTLINDILDLSKIESGRMDIKLDQVDLKPLVAECAASIESLVKPEVQLLQELGEIAPVRTDPDRVRRMVMNLLSNAAKFTKEGSIVLSLRTIDGWAELAVADTGIGIPENDLPHIFDEFRQADSKNGMGKEGTGLGLAIVKKSTDLLGGTIRVESEEERGSVFTLRIRDYEEEGASASADSTEESASP